MKNPELYLSLMSNTMNENPDGKLFFLNKVDWMGYDVVVDFGCANFEMLAAIDSIPMKRTVRLIGVDKYKFEPYKPLESFLHKVEFCSSLSDISLMKIKGKRVLVIFSSVLHEIGVNYVALGEIIAWCRDYAQTVVCRDMYFTPEYLFHGSLGHKAQKKEWDIFAKIVSGTKDPSITSTFIDLSDKLIAIIKNYERHKISLSLTAIMYEFFLKYTYDANWDTEVEEMYLCNNAVELLKELYGSFYVGYERVFTLPYKKKQVRERFNYTMKLPTHIQYILERSRTEG